MTHLYQTTGIVLSRRDWREADRVYSVLTREHGKRELLGRGGSRPLAKLTPHMEFISEADYLVVKGRYFETVAGVERRRAFTRVYEDMSTTLLAHQALRLIDLGTKTKQADPVLYDETIRWLEFLHDAPALSSERSAFLLASFAVKLLSIFGYRPELLRCLSCKIPIAESAFRWHALKGGVVCRPCAERDPEEWFAAREMTNEVLKLIRFSAAESFESLTKIRIEGKDLLDFHDAVESLIISHFPTIPAVSLRGAMKV